MFHNKKTLKLDEAESLYQSAIKLANEEIVDEKLVRDLLRKADRLNHPKAAGDLGIRIFKQALNQSDYKIAFGHLTRGTNLSYNNSILYTAYCYQRGLGTKYNKIEAISLFNKFIKIEENKIDRSENSISNLIHAFLSLADIYQQDKFSPNVLDIVFLNLCRAEQLGSLLAKYNLARIILYKCKNETDRSKILKMQKIWLQKYTELADQHYEDTEFVLGCCYAYTNKDPALMFIEIDEDKAINYFWRAGMGGKYISFHHLFKLYENKDARQSFECLKLAAQLKETVSCLEYGTRLFYDESLELHDQLKGFEIIKEIAISTKNIVALYAYGLLNLKLYQREENAAHKADYFWNSVKALREAAAAPHYFAKYELAKLLKDQNGQYLESYINEVLLNLNDIIQYNAIDINPNILTIQNDAQQLILQIKGNVKDSNIISTISKKNLKNKNNKIHKFNVSKPISKKSQISFSFLSKSFSNNSIFQSTTNIQNSKSLVIKNDESINASSIIPSSTTPLITMIAAQQNDDIDLSIVLSDVLKNVLIKVMSCGHVAYVVGGYVRDKLINSKDEPNDIDIVTSAPIELLEKIFNCKRDINIPFLCRVVLDGIKFDICYADIKKSLVNDAMKRDFTINALYSDIHKIYDPLKRSINDLFSSSNQLVSVLSFDESSSIDSIRILRFLSFRSRGFTTLYTDSQVTNSIRSLSEKLYSFIQKDLTQEILYKNAELKVELYSKFDFHLCKFLGSKNVTGIFEICRQYHFFETLFPNITFTNSSFQWMQWKLHNITDIVKHENAANMRKYLYLTLIAAMIPTSDDIEKGLHYVLENTPLPVDLRWKLKTSELKVFINEMNLYNILPDNKQQQLREITSSQLKTANQSDEFRPIENKNINNIDSFTDNQRSYSRR